MRPSLRAKVVAVCNEKIATKGAAVGLAFHAFVARPNGNPEVPPEAADGRIKTHRLDHFEWAVKIRELVASGIRHLAQGGLEFCAIDAI
jgi:hypothetical protein